MKRKSILLTVLLLVVALCIAACGGKGGSKNDEDTDGPKGPFDFAGNYAAPELTIDGKGDDPQWQAIEEPLVVYGHNNGVKVKAYRGESAMFFLYEVSDSVLLTQGNANDDTVTYGDSVELYLDTKHNGGSRPQTDDFQINLGIHGKTRIMQGAGSQWGNWNGLIDYEVDIKGTFNNSDAQANDTGYTMEVMVPYAQVGIEKDDTIGIAFGQVDKIALGTASRVDWDWYGWTYNGNNVDAQNPNSYVLWDKDGNLASRFVELSGTVINAITDAPVADATVTATIGGAEKTATTNAEGVFSLGMVSSSVASYTVTVTKADYFSGVATYTRSEMLNLSAGNSRLRKNIELISQTDANLVDISGTVKNVIKGVVEGATVRIDGTAVQAATNADGTFTIENAPVLTAAEEVTLVVTKAGYGESKTKIARSAIGSNIAYDCGDVNLNLPYAPTGTFGYKTGLFAESTVRLSRTLSGIEAQFSGTRRLSGHIEMFIDTKETGTNRDNGDSTCWRLDLDGNGTANVIKFSGAHDIPGLTWKVHSNNEDGYEATLLIPYTSLGIEYYEVFGVMFGQWSTTANDWDGWAYPGGEVVAENPTTWVRMAADNTLYKAENNNLSVTLSGNVGVAGASVTVGNTTVMSGVDGSWQITYSIADTTAPITVTYSCVGYKTVTSTIAANTFGINTKWQEEKTLEEQSVTLSGNVSNRNGGSGIENVTVTATVTKSDGTTEDLTAQTGTDGNYTILNVTTYADVTLTFVLDGYETETLTITATEFAALTGDSLVKDAQMTATADIPDITLTGTVTDIDGNVTDATVTIVNAKGEFTLTSDASGAFSQAIKGYATTVTVSKDGYITKELTLGLDELATAGEKALGDIYLARDYAQLGNAFGAKDENFASFVPYVTRGENGFEFKFAGSHAFAGRIEIFVDTGASRHGKDDTDYTFYLNAGKTISAVRGANTNIDTTGLSMKIEGTESAPVVFFTLPYTFMGVSRTDIVGVTFGQNRVSPEDWDGWSGNGEMKGVDGLAFVDPAIPNDYVRIGKNNVPFENSVNYPQDELDLRDYKIRFGNGMDNFHAKVSRNDSGVTFSFVTESDFATSHNPVQNVANSTELILVYLDIGEAKGDWQNDYILKIASDGNVYLATGAWWTPSDVNKIGTVTFNKANGINQFTFTLEYSSFGCNKDAVFGLTMVEGWIWGPDQSAFADSYGGCVITLPDASYTVGDAANEATFIRVKADGTLAKADSNAAVA